MDLDELGREELEARAERLGVEDVKHKTRRQLVQAIARSSGRSTAELTLDAAKSLFGLAATVARSLRTTLPLRPARPPSERVTRPLRPERPPEARATVPLRPARPAEPAVPKPTESAEVREPSRDPADARDERSPDERATVSLKAEALTSTPEASRPDGDDVERRPDQRATVSLKTDALTPTPEPGRHADRDVGRRSDQRATVSLKPVSLKTDALNAVEGLGAEASTRAPERSADEPIVTLTMARLLDEQGHRARALAMYDDLMRRHPEDGEIASARERARARAKGRTSKPTRDEDADADGDEVVALRVDGTTVVASWEVSERSVAEAREEVGAGGELVARAVIVRPSLEDLVEREVVERPAERAGHWVVADLAPDAHTVVALGWPTEEGFHSLAHAPVVAPVESATEG